MLVAIDGSSFGWSVRVRHYLLNHRPVHLRWKRKHVMRRPAPLAFVLGCASVIGLWACGDGSVSPGTPDDTGVQSSGDAPADAPTRRARDAGTDEWDVDRPTDVFGEFAPSDATGRRSPAWVRLVGTDQYMHDMRPEQMSALALDDGGHIFVVGGIDDGRHDHRDHGTPLDGYLAKFDLSGNREWLKRTGIWKDDRLDDVAVGPDGAVYVVSRAGFLSRYDDSGSRRWRRRFLDPPSGNRHQVEPRAVAVGGDGIVYVAGATRDRLGGSSFYGGTEDGMIASYEPSGVRRWARSIGTSGEDDAVDVAVDGRDRIYVVGRAEIAKQDESGFDAYLVGFDAGGAERWRRVIGTNGEDRARHVAVAPNGDVYLAGSSDTPPRRGALDVVFTPHGFFARYSSSGTLRWARRVGFGGFGSVTGLAADGSGPYVTGRTAIGDDALGSYLAAFDSTGAQRWAEFTATPDDEVVLDIAVGPRGKLYAVGRTGHGYEGQPYNGGDWDAFLMAFE